MFVYVSVSHWLAHPSSTHQPSPCRQEERNKSFQSQSIVHTTIQLVKKEKKKGLQPISGHEQLTHIRSITVDDLTCSISQMCQKAENGVCVKEQWCIVVCVVVEGANGLQRWFKWKVRFKVKRSAMPCCVWMDSAPAHAHVHFEIDRPAVKTFRCNQGKHDAHEIQVIKFES